MDLEAACQQKTVAKCFRDDDKKAERSLSSLSVENNSRPIFLKKSSDFAALAKLGRRKKVAPWLEIRWLQNPLKKNQFGIVVPRTVGTAVERNQIKRWWREAVRHTSTRADEKGQNMLFLVRGNNRDRSQQLSFSEMQLAVDRAMSLHNF